MLDYGMILGGKYMLIKEVVHGDKRVSDKQKKLSVVT